MCHCNNIRTEDVQEARESGCKNVKECCNYLGMDIQCATCVNQIKSELEERDE